MDLYEQTTAILKERLTQYESGLCKWDLSDILKIRGELRHDRPTADHYLTVLLNAFEFLTNEFALQDGDPPDTVPRFLNEFRAAMQRDLLSKISTYKDGIALSLE